MGKTALVSKFLDNLEFSAAVQQPDIVFASTCDSYEDVRSSLIYLIKTLDSHASDQIPTDELIDIALSALLKIGHSLIVLDGVERLPLPLFSLLQSKLEQVMTLKTIVTSRLSNYLGSEVISLNGLDINNSIDLLRSLNPSKTTDEYHQISSLLHGHPLSLMLAAPLLDTSRQFIESIQTKGPDRPLEAILPRILGRIDERLCERERALLARIALFRIGVTIEDLEMLFVQSEDSAVSGPLKGLTTDKIEFLLCKLNEMSLIQLEAKNEGSTIVLAHPILRDYFLQGIPDASPLHQRVHDHYINLLEANDQPIEREAAEIILEVVHHLLASKQIDSQQIKKLAARLPRDETPTVLAYSTLLDAAIQLEAQVQEPTGVEGKGAPRAFLSYVREDIQQVTRLRNELERHGIDIWQDIDRLIPGKRWKAEIRDAIKSGDFFIACFSKNYAARSRTYMREELLTAIEELRLRPTDRAWFIPVLLSQSEIPQIPISSGETLRDLHWVSVGDDWDSGISALLRALKS
jgi:hypothetical protein